MSSLLECRNKLEQYSEIFDMIAASTKNQFLYMTDSSSDYTRLSLNTVDYFDLPGEYLRNFFGIWIELVHPDDRQRLTNDLQLIADGKVNNHDIEYRVKNKYGEYVNIRCGGQVTRNTDGSVKLFVGMMENMGNKFKYDPLTKLLSKYVADDTIISYIDNSKYCEVMLLDIDNFKRINTLYGYSFGNKVLCKVADELKSLCKGYVYRRTDDNYMVIHNGELKSIDIFNRLNNKIGSIVIDGIDVSLSVSAGVSVYPKVVKSFGEMIESIEEALNVARDLKSKRGYYEYTIDNKRKHELLIQIREAIDESVDNNCEGFYMVYQPLISSKTGEIFGAEALLRFNHENLKIFPDTFIPILEDTGEINEVGEFIFRESFKQAKKWIEKIPNFRISVNVSYAQLRHNEFYSKLQDIINEIGISPKSIILELTESCKVIDAGRLKEDFIRCKESGIMTALDDFGTGYSSIAMLRELGPDIIKVDHTFVLSINENKLDMNILEYIIELAHSAEIEVVVEGIENNTIFETVSKLEPEILQGYNFDKPLTAKEFEEKYIN